ncbi:MAG TPA: metallophosphoesterase [Gemmatimonadaceae bacterium]|jgi:hypothetical protein
MAAKKPKRSAAKKPAAKKRARKADRGSATVHRFAHPFYDLTPANTSPARPADAAPIADFTESKLEPIPKPKRSPPEMDLSEIIGDAGRTGVQSSGKIIFHAFGDSGNPATENQELVSDAMTEDYDTTKPEISPSFLLHIGDVIYYDNTDSGYHEQFYAPYKRYPGKIVAIPGNHDGELFKYDGSSTGQKVTLGAFQQNFCQRSSILPPAAGTIYRQMVSQPGVYWRLGAPFVDVVGLYSNIGETSGFISGPRIGMVQKDWLIATITAIKQARKTGPRKAFILAVHHPLYSSGGHEPSISMHADIDDACTQGGLMPDVVLTAHAHNYQRFTRRYTFSGRKLEIPYIVAGTAGRGIQAIKQAADGQLHADATFEKSLNGFGFLRVIVTTDARGAAVKVKLDFVQVEADKQHRYRRSDFDSATVDLASAKVS